MYSNSGLGELKTNHFRLVIYCNILITWVNIMLKEERRARSPRNPKVAVFWYRTSLNSNIPRGNVLLIINIVLDGLHNNEPQRIAGRCTSSICCSCCGNISGDLGRMATC